MVLLSEPARLCWERFWSNSGPLLHQLAALLFSLCRIRIYSIISRQSGRQSSDVRISIRFSWACQPVPTSASPRNSNVNFRKRLVLLPSAIRSEGEIVESFDILEGYGSSASEATSTSSRQQSPFMAPLKSINPETTPSNDTQCHPWVHPTRSS
jgi:hypothetical protein